MAHCNMLQIWHNLELLNKFCMVTSLAMTGIGVMKLLTCTEGDGFARAASA